MSRRVFLALVCAAVLTQPAGRVLTSRPGEIRVGSISLPGGVGLAFGYGWGATHPPFSGSFPEQVAYPLGEGSPPPFLLVPRGYENETLETGTCPSCPAIGGQTCRYPVLSYSLGRLIEEIPEGVMLARLSGTTWLPAYKDEDTNPGAWEPVTVRYDDGLFYIGGTGDQEINATDIFTGRTEYYSLNKPGFAPIFDTTGHGTAILYEGASYDVPFLNRTLFVEDINLLNATIVVYRGGELETMLFLEYSSAVDPATGHVGKLFVYLNDLGGPRIRIDDFPVIFFLDVLRVDNVDQRFMEVVLSGPWVDNSVLLRVDRDGDGIPDVTEVGKTWPRDAPPSNYDWFLLEGEKGPLMVGYLRINGTRVGPFALPLGGWLRVAEARYGISSITLWNGTAAGPYWYSIDENGSWPLGEVRQVGNLTWVLTSVEPDAGNGECGPVECGRWRTFGLYELGGGICLRTEPGKCCRLTSELGFLGLHDYWSSLNPAAVSPQNRLAFYSWSPPGEVVEKYFGCYPRRDVPAAEVETGGGFDRGTIGGVGGESRPANASEEVGGEAAPNGTELRIVSARTDRAAAEVLSSLGGAGWFGAIPSRIVLGGPSAIPEGAEAAEVGGIMFTSENGTYTLWVESLEVGWSVTGGDWARRDYAAVFAYREEGGGIVYAGMGITRYGTMAASVWMAANLEEISPGTGYVLRWVDDDGNGVVELGEILTVARFGLPGTAQSPP